MQSQDKVQKLKDSLSAMKDSEKKTEASPATSAVSEEAALAQNPKDPAKSELEQLRAENEKLKQEVQENRDKYLRQYADFENFRKRVVREKDDLARYSTEKIIKELIPVLDNFEQALLACRQASDIKSVVQGIELVLKQLIQNLEKFGLKKLESQGKAFDPNFHEAMAHHETEAHPPNSVVQEFRPGYQLHERVVRPALVSVAKAPETEKKH